MVGYGKSEYPHGRSAVVNMRNHRQHKHRPILVALFATFEKLPMPEVRVAKEPADFWFSRQHACPSGPQH